MLSYLSFTLAAWAKGTEGNLFPLWSRTTFKFNFDESVNKRHWAGLYSWPRTSITEQTSFKTRHHLPGRRNHWILHGAHGKNTLVSWSRRCQPFNLERKVRVIEKFWKHIWIQCPKIHQKHKIFLMGQNLCWPCNLQRLVQLSLHINSIKVEADMRTLILNLWLVHAYVLEPV